MDNCGGRSKLSGSQVTPQYVVSNAVEVVNINEL